MVDGGFTGDTTKPTANNTNNTIIFLLMEVTGSCNDNHMVKVKFRLRIVFYRNPVILGMESPDHTYNHTFIVFFFFWRFVEANLKVTVQLKMKISQ